MEFDRQSLDEWAKDKPLSILQLDPADRAVLKIAGKPKASVHDRLVCVCAYVCVYDGSSKGARVRREGQPGASPAEPCSPARRPPARGSVTPAVPRHNYHVRTGTSTRQRHIFLSCYGLAGT